MSRAVPRAEVEAAVGIRFRSSDSSPACEFRTPVQAGVCRCDVSKQASKMNGQ
jgi:hypothetical protein